MDSFAFLFFNYIFVFIILDYEISFISISSLVYIVAKLNNLLIENLSVDLFFFPKNPKIISIIKFK